MYNITFKSQSQASSFLKEKTPGEVWKTQRVLKQHLSCSEGFSSIVKDSQPSAFAAQPPRAATLFPNRGSPKWRVLKYISRTKSVLYCRKLGKKLNVTLIPEDMNQQWNFLISAQTVQIKQATIFNFWLIWSPTADPQPGALAPPKGSQDDEHDLNFSFISCEFMDIFSLFGSP